MKKRRVEAPHRSMTIVRVKQQPIKLPDSGKRDVRTQFGALCYRIRKGSTQILLVTSRTSRRWIVPKGWPADGVTPAKAAAIEAYEEAGVEGKITGNVIGLYSYTKGMGPENDLPCVVTVFPLLVKRIHVNYPEMKQRKRKWFSPAKAAKLVAEPELRLILKTFDPHAVTIH